MPYYFFKDREFSRSNASSLEMRVVNYFRKREKTLILKTKTVGIALQSASSQILVHEGIPYSNKPLVIHFIKKHFRVLSSESDPTKPMITDTLPGQQMKLRFESMLKKIINETIENKDFLDQYIDGRYVINEDGTISSNKSSLVIKQSINNVLPARFNSTDKGFYCSNIQLTSLEGCPKSIGRSFLCNHNNLTSLDYFPDEVKGSFYCNNNPNLQYKELFKIVDKVKGDIYYTSPAVPEDKDKIRRDRDKYYTLQHDELGNLDI